MLPASLSARRQHCRAVSLQGKYQDMRNAPPEARLIKYRGRYAEAEQRYGPKPNVHEAVGAYCRLAEQAGMPAFELSIRWGPFSRLGECNQLLRLSALLGSGC